MTTLAVLADIHGNLPALQAVMQDMAQFEIDQVVVAGDVVNWGPFSAQCMDVLVREGWPVIRGNNEFYLLDYNTQREPDAWKDRAQWSLLAWLHEQLRGEHRTRIASWPDTLSLRFADGPPIRVVHGCGHSPWEGLFAKESSEDTQAKLAGVEERFVVAAHTHLPMDHAVGQWHIFNPGSVGVPLDGQFCARYMLLESRADGRGWQPKFRQVAIDNMAVLDEFRRQQFVERCGVIGQLVVDEFVTARLQVLPFIYWRNAVRSSAPLTAALYEEFTAADPWPFTPLPYHVNR